MNEPFYLSDEQRMIRDLARKIARERVAPNAACPFRAFRPWAFPRPPDLVAGPRTLRERLGSYRRHA